MAVKFLTHIIVVDCKSESEQISRFLKRNSDLKREDALLRIKSQMANDERLKRADFVIDNSGNFESTKRQVLELYKKYNASKLFLRLRIGILISIAIVYLTLR